MTGVVFANPFGEYTAGIQEGSATRLKEEQLVFQTIVQPALSAREKGLDRALKEKIAGVRAARASARQSAAYSQQVQQRRAAAAQGSGPITAGANRVGVQGSDSDASRVVPSGAFPGGGVGQTNVAFPDGGSGATGLPPGLTADMLAGRVARPAGPGAPAAAGTGSPVSTSSTTHASTTPAAQLLPASPRDRAIMPQGTVAPGAELSRVGSELRAAGRRAVGVPDDRTLGVMSPAVAAQLNANRTGLTIPPPSAAGTTQAELFNLYQYLDGPLLAP